LTKFANKIMSLIDATSLRERVLLFVAMAVVLIAIADSLVISPMAERERKLRAAIAGYQAELDTAETYIRNMVNSRGADPDAPARALHQSLLEQIARIDVQIAQEQERFTSPERMRAVLEETLRATPGVQLVQLKSLPTETLAEMVPAPGGTGGIRTRIYRHGFELTVGGGYFDLYAYLRYLERTPRIYWGKADYAVGGYPNATLKLTVYTLSLDRTWIQV
jgi:MSHA biogenesis protein MshJ